MKFKLFELSQKVLIIIYNKLYKKIQMVLILKNSKNLPPIRSRNKNLFLLSKNIVEFVIRNDINQKEVFKDLDQESKTTINRVLKSLEFFYTNSIIDKNNLLTKDELNKKKEINETIKTVKKNIILRNKNYRGSVFYSHNGLKFLPQEIKYSLIDKDFLDCGAFNGDSSIVFARFYQPKKIYAFEPEPKNFKRLIETIKTNNLKKIKPIRLGLGEKEGVLRIKSQGGSSFISDKGEHHVKIITIDEFVKENNLNVGLIKMDIEGFELYALKGAEKTIQKFRPILLISIYHNGKQFFETKNFIQNICSKYKIIIRKLDPLMLFRDICIIAWVH
ncbi:MAG: FkbM family methyltransferase [Promethearchaeota archaeon]